MQRYSDIDVALNELEHTPFFDKRDFETAKQMLKTMPTSDVVKVKHGKWIKMSDADGVYWACSECGEDIPRIAHYNPQFDLFPRLESIDKTSFCPNCGADMRDWNQR